MRVVIVTSSSAQERQDTQLEGLVFYVGCLQVPWPGLEKHSFNDVTSAD